MSKVYKFKIADVSITVNLDHSFSNPSNVSKSDFISSLNLQHCHPIYEMFFIKDLPLTFFAEGKATEYTNCALCIPPNFNHHSFRQADYRILFSYENNKKDSESFARFISSFASAMHPFKLKTSTSLMNYVKDFSALLSSKNTLDDEIAKCFLKIIFYNLYELNTNTKRNTPLSSNESYLSKIENIVNFFQNDVNLKTVADALCLSTKQASRVIIKNYGKPLSAVMLEKRLNIACILLKYTESTISEIVEFVHFPSESYFYSQFKKAYGCTPYKYKKLTAEPPASDTDNS